MKVERYESTRGKPSVVEASAAVFDWSVEISRTQPILAIRCERSLRIAASSDMLMPVSPAKHLKKSLKKLESLFVNTWRATPSCVREVIATAGTTWIPSCE